MASNTDLIGKILDLDPNAVTNGLTNNQLSALLKSLKKHAAEVAAEVAPEAAEVAPEAAEVAAEPGYYVSDGKSITTLAGMKGEGAKVEPKFFVHGQQTIDDLVSKGFVTKR